MIAQDEGFTEVKYNAAEALKETLIAPPAREGSRDWILSGETPSS